MVFLKTSSKRRANLAGTVAGRTGDVELRGVVFIEAEDKFRASDLLDLDQRGERNLTAVGAANVELIDVSNVGARRAFGFHVGLPLAAETIEVIHEITAHEGLHGGVNVRETHLLLQSLLAIDIDIELRNCRLVRGNGSADLFSIFERAQKGEYVLRQRCTDRRFRSDLREPW